MRWIIDIDGTICDTEYTKNNGKWQYKQAKPNKEMIDKINILYDMGEYIILFTARGTITHIDYREMTERQLKEWGVKYNELRFDKPGGEIYIDDRTITPSDFLDRFSFYQGLCV